MILDDGAVVEAEVVAKFADIDAAVIAVDMPYLLQSEGWRVADREAKRLLGARHSTIFMTPPGAVVDCDTYDAANALCRQLTGGGLSRQMFNLFARIREVAAARMVVYEVHPELAFMGMAGEVLPSKRGAAGRLRRRTVLDAAGIDLPAGASHDMLDAAACALVAQHIHAGTARSLPSGRPPVIWY